MNNENNPIRDDQFEAFLDGTLPEAEREEILEHLNDDRRAEVETQRKIDAALRKVFPVVTAPDDLSLVFESDESVAESHGSLPRRPLLAGGLAAAAVLIGIALTFWAFNAGKPAPFFKPIPLAQIYRETLQNGFHPYYECHDDQRFADIFAARQGMDMHLEPMPEGTRMLGLSYPGGLSRDTTAMLCMVDESPVMVFVDRAASDSEIAAKVARDSEIQVFRSEREGLVFYEVSELDEPRAMQYMAIGPPR
ncbi:anti-sigma factor family protein [Bythopirellula goksoeyrii]|uniref:Uncharacterized protein n=1 Tax=Bythopirellula goksoeyrii TaxID=1400387 RepID=A0A5B9QE50_9BACT|nr:zf-HC2 domain-containing protein [Bythopirellula goksoeyrii]QEG37214.1 hypothetical protein Pr1d_45550 [Bythopirellula goksoeyrii]